MEIPPTKVRIYEFVLIRAYKPPIQSNFEKTLVDDKSVENINNKIKEIKDCCNNKDKNVLNQVLKNHEVEWLVKQSIAKGVNKTKTLTMTYLREYENIKLNKLIDTKPLINPSNEKILKSVSLTETTLFNCFINSEKEISKPKILEPKLRIACEIRLFNSKSCWQI